MSEIEFTKMNFVFAKVCLDDYRETWEIKKYLVYDITKLEIWLDKKYMNYEIVFATTLRDTRTIAQFQPQISNHKKKYLLI